MQSGPHWLRVGNGRHRSGDNNSIAYNIIIIMVDCGKEYIIDDKQLLRFC